MAFNLDAIRVGGVTRPPRMVVLGTEKIGKSTFAAGADNSIFIPILGEEGIDDIPVAQFPTSRTLEDVHGWLDALGTQDHDWMTGVIDSVSSLEPLIHDFLCRKYDVDSIEKVLKGFGKGYTEAAKLMRGITDKIDALRTYKNMAFILIGHVQVETFNDPNGPSYEHYEFDVHKKTRNLLYRWADAIVFANTKASVKVTEHFGKDKGKAQDFSGGERYLYTQKRPAHPGGGRGVFGRLPYEMPLSWEVFKAAVATAS